ncbi:MAG: hydrolase [Oceanicaulis sp.]|uniref:hydrolase n=1 Tax=Glycocaulis sp. TaxID=1969725 RepID=UPI0025BD9F3B|nr:hydrolase [Glycocaulis sp.]MCC5982102.1 hydrolase [Oceanicaulis sp.]MCH8521187.1 hydrolase [Glycocaulis sp.]
MNRAITLSAEETAILDWVDTRADGMIATVKDWAAINTGSRNADGLEVMRARLTEAFAELEARIEPVELPSSQTVTNDGEIVDVDYTPALKISQRPDAPIRIVLTGHSDTVFAADHPFQNWQMLDEDTLNGPGVADMKGGLLVMLHALLALERSPWASAIGYDVLISPDEEIGSLGSGPILAELGKRADIGMTYEPALADGSLAGARKGSGNFSLRVKGKAAHAGREHHLGRNAIVAAAAFAEKIDRLNGERPAVTINVSRIDGGGAPNVVPDIGVVRFNVRVGDEEDAAWVKAELARAVADTNQREGIFADLHGGFTRPPKPMSPSNLRMFEWTREAGRPIGLDIQWKDTGGVCEGNNLWASGCPNVDTLGVRGADIHSSREIAKLSSFAEKTKLSAIMLMKFAKGEFNAREARALARSL